MSSHRPLVSDIAIFVLKRDIKLQLTNSHRPLLAVESVADLCCAEDLEGLSIRHLTVEVVRATSKKRYVGGYRSRATGVVYHHAAVQTPPMRTVRDVSSSMRTRATQTHALRHFTQQTAESTSTQMTGVGVYVPDLTDRLVEPRRYVSADEFLKIREAQVCLLVTCRAAPSYNIMALITTSIKSNKSSFPTTPYIQRLAYIVSYFDCCSTFVQCLLVCVSVCALVCFFSVCC